MTGVKQGDVQTDEDADTQTSIEADVDTVKRKHRQTGTQADGHTGRRTHRQTGTQADGQRITPLCGARHGNTFPLPCHSRTSAPLGYGSSFPTFSSRDHLFSEIQ